jgi:hypothetical protein
MPTSRRTFLKRALALPLVPVAGGLVATQPDKLLLVDPRRPILVVTCPEQKAFL